MFSCFQSSYSKEKINNQESQAWWDLITQLVDAQPEKKPFHEPKRLIRKVCYNIVINKAFEFFIFVVIVVNLITMTIYYEDGSKVYKEVLDLSNIAFTVVFFIEMVLKIIAYKKEYFKDEWNKFDSFVVVTGIVEVSVSISSDQNLIFGGLFKVFQVLRVLRVFRVIRYNILLMKGYSN